MVLIFQIFHSKHEFTERHKIVVIRFICVDYSYNVVHLTQPYRQKTTISLLLHVEFTKKAESTQHKLS